MRRVRTDAPSAVSADRGSAETALPTTGKGKSMSADSRGTSTQTRREYQMFVLQQRLLFGSILAGTALGVLAITYF
ncbi:hypothetical protein AS590_06450 [Prescottella equi]|uniref:hypothetical protein n=1 Tax=Rhodococcus TaxID=1827 RepID=UPI0002B7D881|nr:MULTISPECIES: hypothetical protein [Rhodococcus]EME25280.1 hypothetical protein G418_01551 [Rhodococcus qingshengii BKS 20-40]KZF12955.1 hypothetical protein A2J01_13735 [Rhodococcus sp. EPR-134]OCC17895.1 hypothetical protein AS590_06450 [Prescottella equi]OFE06250.1 hypothetical protein A5N83_23290 [Rhodococcus sp. 1139]OKA13268.1 hypothetical protein BS618_19615 [Rhodococcus erythropolis]